VPSPTRSTFGAGLLSFLCQFYKHKAPSEPVVFPNPLLLKKKNNETALAQTKKKGVLTVVQKRG
jgi:hypothetical protein